MCTRFLFAVLPSELYWGDKSLNHLNGFLADNLQTLYTEGVTVTWLDYVELTSAEYRRLGVSCFKDLAWWGWWTPHIWLHAGRQRRLAVSQKGGVRYSWGQVLLNPGNRCMRPWPSTAATTADASATFVHPLRLVFNYTPLASSWTFEELSGLFDLFAFTLKIKIPHICISLPRNGMIWALMLSGDLKTRSTAPSSLKVHPCWKSQVWPHQAESW